MLHLLQLCKRPADSKQLNQLFSPAMKLTEGLPDGRELLNRTQGHGFEEMFVNIWCQYGFMRKVHVMLNIQWEQPLHVICVGVSGPYRPLKICLSSRVWLFVNSKILLRNHSLPNTNIQEKTVARILQFKRDKSWLFPWGRQLAEAQSSVLSQKNLHLISAVFSTSSSAVA